MATIAALTVDPAEFVTRIEQISHSIVAHREAVANLKRRYAVLVDVPDPGNRYSMRRELEREQASLIDNAKKLCARSEEIIAFLRDRFRLDDEQLEAGPKQTMPSPN